MSSSTSWPSPKRSWTFVRCSRRRPIGRRRHSRRVGKLTITPPDPPIDSLLVDCSHRTPRASLLSRLPLPKVARPLHLFVATVTTALHCCSMSGPGGVCGLQRQTYRRGVRARRAVLSPFQVNRPAKSKVHIPSGLLIRGSSRSDCLVSKASDFAIRAKFYCFYVASNRWYRGNMPPYSPEGRQFDPSWARRWRSSR